VRLQQKNPAASLHGDAILYLEDKVDSKDALGFHDHRDRPCAVAWRGLHTAGQCRAREGEAQAKVAGQAQAGRKKAKPAKQARK